MDPEIAKWKLTSIEEWHQERQKSRKCQEAISFSWKTIALTETVWRNYFGTLEFIWTFAAPENVLADKLPFISVNFSCGYSDNYPSLTLQTCGRQLGDNNLHLWCHPMDLVCAIRKDFVFQISGFCVQTVLLLQIAKGWAQKLVAIVSIPTD